MAEVQSYIFDFQRVPSFFEEWNNSFKVEDMKDSSTDASAKHFQIVYCDVAPSNINDCLNGSRLNTSSVHVLQTVDVNLKYDNDVISVRYDATWSLGTDIKPVKAIFIRNKSNGYVMGYSINTVAFEVTNTVKLEKDTILWSIVDG